MTAENKSSVADGLGYLTTFLLAFAGVALFVGSFIIVNTFSMLVAQRTRELALIRAVGASRGAGRPQRPDRGRRDRARRLGPRPGPRPAIAAAPSPSSGSRSEPTSSPVSRCTPPPCSGHVPVGTVVTVVSAVLPARRASRIAPGRRDA